MSQTVTRNLDRDGWLFGLLLDLLRFVVEYSMLPLDELWYDWRKMKEDEATEATIMTKKRATCG